jgi:DNA-binding CsgD family transcriptional regulator
VVLLVGECYELMRVGDSPMLHALEGVARFANAEVALWLRATAQRGKPPIIDEIFEHGWASSSDRAHVLGHVASVACDEDPLFAHVMRTPDRLVTVTREDVQSDRSWRASQTRAVHVSSGIDESLVSARFDHAGAVCGIVLKRGLAEKPFDDRARSLVSLFQLGAPWFCDAPRPTSEAEARLCSREREMLRLLLTGVSEKSAAATLGVSPHTAHDYAKIIYRKLGVSSRAQLMARMLKVRAG